MPAATGSLYPVLQIPPDKKHLKGFAWFDYVRPTDPEDVFNWRSKSAENLLVIERKSTIPLQKLNKTNSPMSGTTVSTETATPTETPVSTETSDSSESSTSAESPATNENLLPSGTPVTSEDSVPTDSQ